MWAICRKLFTTFECKSVYFSNARVFISDSFNASGSKNTIDDSLVICRYLFCSPCSLKRLGDDAGNQNKPEEGKLTSKSKKEKQIYVTLIGIDDNVTVCTLEEAKKIAERRNLKILKVKDFVTKTSRPEYKLMTNAQYLEEDRIHREELKKNKDQSIKGDKILSISHKISEHDLSAKIKMMKKWLDKHYEVRIVISGDGGGAVENIYKVIEKEVKTDGKIVQKGVKKNDIKFQILPLKRTGSSESSSTENKTEEAGK